MKRIASVILALGVLWTSVPSQSGGEFDITRSVIAGGGKVADGVTFLLDGTIGQPVTKRSTGNGFAIAGGFWSNPLAPTSAGVSISGRVLTADGAGIRNVQLTLATPNGNRRAMTTGAFGHYRFDDVLAGDVYILSVISNRFEFGRSSIVIHVVDEMMNLDFIANP